MLEMDRFDSSSQRTFLAKKKKTESPIVVSKSK